MFFDTTVTYQVYIELFREFVNQLDDQELTLGYYQQDGATSHTSGVSIVEVESFFPDRVISRGLRPPRSPDLTPPDVFLWDHLKGRAYMRVTALARPRSDLTLNYRPVLSSERALQNNNAAAVYTGNFMAKEKLVTGPRWAPDTGTDWQTDCRS
jgi:hypothetical protein